MLGCPCLINASYNIILFLGQFNKALHLSGLCHKSKSLKQEKCPKSLLNRHLHLRKNLRISLSYWWKLPMVITMLFKFDWITNQCLKNPPQKGTGWSGSSSYIHIAQQYFQDTESKYHNDKFSLNHQLEEHLWKKITFTIGVTTCRLQSMAITSTVAQMAAR